MPNPRQQLSARGIRVMAGFVLVYLAAGSYLYFLMELPAFVYVAYGVASWVAGMWLFYRLHRSFADGLGGEVD